MQNGSRGWLAAAMSVATAGGLAACGGEDTGDRPPAGGQARTVAITIDDARCSPAKLRLPAGAVTFAVTNRGTTKLNEFEVLRDGVALGEQEQVPVGATRTFTLRLVAGTYATKCLTKAGTTDVAAGVTVTGAGGERVGSAAAAKAVATYRGYLERQSAALVSRTRAFTAAVIAGDEAQAKARYAPARIPYERIEPVAESFGDLDPAIDARVNDVEPGHAFTGFHRIERALWQDGTLKGMAAIARRLMADVQRLDRLVRDVSLQPEQIANGANELLGEVSKSKITGEEERYSRIDLVDFEANVEGARAAFDAVAPLLRGSHAALAEEIQRRFVAASSALDQHRRGGGFVPYPALHRSDKLTLSRSIDALAEPLSQVASRVVATG